MAHIPPLLDNSEYAVGWMAALPHERAAAETMLDKKHPPPQHKHPSDNNIYTLGSINGPNGEHNVVIASLPPGRYGTTDAATAASQMLSSFPNIKFGLMVGIGGGIPSKYNDIRLGDVVVSKPEGTFGGVRQYDCGKATARGFEERGALNTPPRVLLNAIGALESKYEMTGSAIPSILNAVYDAYPLMAKPRKGSGYIYQGADHDRLFHPDYEHAASNNDCSQCDTTQEVVRLERSDLDPFIHYGTIASGNQVIKDARKRDIISENCLCFETEAAGLMNDFPCLVIRGICDYSDTHKNDRWQRYAAATAAAYAKELLQITDAADVKTASEARSAMHKLQKIESTVEEIALGKRQRHLDRKVQDIFRWLSPLNPSALNFENQKKRVEGTGTWMLGDSKFCDWSSKTPKCRTLCCYGDPGAGKTIISSFVIDKLREQVGPGSKIGLGYIYCDYRDQKQQTTENILGAVLKQLLELLPKLPETVLKLYEERVHEKKRLSVTDANTLLYTACAQFSKIYVCLDALDELTDLRGLLKCLHGRPFSMQLFITSRPHIRETIQKHIEAEEEISIKAHESDLRRYIEHEICGPNDIEPDAMNKRLKAHILEKVIDSAKGIFLLPTLQIRAVLQAPTIRDREETLQRLPSNLSEAFAGTITRIKQQPNALSRRAGKVIAWIHLAERPPTVDDLLYSLAVKDGDASFDPRGIPIRDTLLNCCHGLAVIDQETSTVRLVHYSLDEYLREQEQILGLTKTQWHSKIASTCLTLLRFPSLTGREASEDSSITTTLLPYAATQWGHHLRRGQDLPDAPIALAKEYLNNSLKENPLSFQLWFKAVYPKLYDRKLFNSVLAVHIVAYFGISSIMLDLILTASDVDAKDGYHHTPLSWAARNGHEIVVKLLLGKGAAVDSVDSFRRTPLSWASENGHKAVVKLLLEKGATIGLIDWLDRKPLSWASENGHEAVVELLLVKDAAVDLVPWDARKPLSLASENGHERIVKLLLEKGAAVDSADRQSGRTPLSWASGNGHEAVVKLLFEKGVVVDSVDKYSRTPLSWASGKGYDVVVKLLLDKGATADSVDTIYSQTPLSLASEKGYEAVVKLLLERGAAVDRVDRSGQTPLSWASKKGHLEVVQLLLKKGAAVDRVDGSNPTPLSWASKNGYEAVVKLLLDEDAMVDSVDRSGRTPLSLASGNGHEVVVKLLLEKGTVVDSVDESSRTPLSWASDNGHEAVVKLLLKKGAAVYSVDKSGRTPLSWASESGHEIVVKLLLEKGAAVDSVDRSGRTSLLWASEKGYETVVKLLLEKGAPLDFGGKSGRTPLSWASESGHETVVRLLLEKGAVVDSIDRSCRTPLSWASENGHGAVVMLLLEKGALVDSVDTKFGRTPLSWASGMGYEAVVTLLLDRGATIDWVDSQQGRTPLSWASGKGYEAVVKLLLEKDAAVDSVDTIYSRTPLSWASGKGYETVVKLLLEKSALVDSVDRSGRTPLSWASGKGYETVVKLLLEKGAVVDSVDRSGRTPLSWASENGHEAVVKLLLEKSTVVDSVDKPGRTPLSWASGKGYETVVKLLLEKGTAVDSIDKSGRTPLSWASESGHGAVVKLLLEEGAAVDSVDTEFGRTPLSWASGKGYETVRLLLERGALVDSVDSFGRTPLSWASETGHVGVVKLLLEKGAVVDSVDRFGRTPLSLASENGHKAVVMLLRPQTSGTTHDRLQWYLRGHRSGKVWC